MDSGDWPEVRCVRGAKLRVRLPPGKPIQVGPAYTAELCLPEAAGSGVFVWTGEAVLLEPEAGSDCFEVGGKRIAGPTSLGSGTEVHVGAYTLVVSGPGRQGVGATASSAATAAPGRPRVLAGEEEVSRVILRQGISIGCDAECDYRIVPGGTPPARRAYCVTVGRLRCGFEVAASGFDETGVLMNGQLFSRRNLVLGDYLQIGPLCFRYDGEGGLLPGVNSLGASLEARDIAVSFDGAKLILDGAQLQVPAGHFVGILGPSGSGKTTLLRAVSDLLDVRRGEVLLDGRPIPASSSGRRSLIGFVPQDDIVHLDLTVHEALRFGARLRLSDKIPRREIETLIERVVGRIFFQLRDRDFESVDPDRLGRIHTRIADLLGKRVGALSGGQRKRVSVAVELMSRPRILFLDEPTSGLDPASEQELMSMLRDVTNSGCSVVCTTHVLENVWRMHSFAVVFGGKVVFQGDSGTARSHFGVQDLSTIYRVLGETPERWRAVTPSRMREEQQVLPPVRPPSSKNPLRQGFLLMHRQWDLLKRDGASIALLVGQPLLIGLALSLVAVEERAIPYKLFFGLVVAFWFGCSNAAPQIVREKAVLNRERGVGLGLAPYLAAKFIFFGALTILQVTVLWIILSIPWYPDVGTYPAAGNPRDMILGYGWQAFGAAGVALCATAWGMAVSAWAQRPAQASFVVPLLVIPQILFSGFVFTLADWKAEDGEGIRARLGKAVVRNVARAIPGYSGQRVMETSLIWNETYPGLRHIATPRKRAYENLEVVADPKAWERFEEGERPWRNPRPALWSLLSLAAWTAVSLVFAVFGLRRGRL